jgi:hypothetical protein
VAGLILPSSMLMEKLMHDIEDLEPSIKDKLLFLANAVSAMLKQLKRMLTKNALMRCCKLFCSCLLFVFTFTKTFAQKQNKDSATDNIQQYHFRYYHLPGIDSATFDRRFDSAWHRKLLMGSLLKKYDSLLQQQRKLITPFIPDSFAYTSKKN